MSEDNHPQQWAERIAEAQQIIRDTEPLIRQAQEAQQFFRRHESLIRQLQPVIQAHAALWPQIEPIVQAAKQFAITRPLTPFQLLLVRTADAALGDLMGRGPVANQRTASLVVTPTMTATATVTGRLDLTAQRAPSTGHATVEKCPSGRAERSIGQILAVVLVTILACGLMGVQGPSQAVVDHYMTVIGTALTIAVLIWNKQK